MSKKGNLNNKSLGNIYKLCLLLDRVIEVFKKGYTKPFKINKGWNRNLKFLSKLRLAMEKEIIRISKNIKCEFASLKV